MSKAERDLDNLVEYLREEKGWEIPQYELHLSRRQTQDNEIDPRAFAHVVKGKPDSIFTCAAIEVIPRRFRVGILLHEIVHLHRNLLSTEENEVDVDAVIVTEIPEAGYTYDNLRYEYRGRVRQATNLQRVTGGFPF